MTGISLTHALHKLTVTPSARPIRQRVRRFHSDRHQVIQAEVDNLLKVGFIREIKYLEWLVNVVVVPKKGGKWRVCVDYTVLNNVCPKDSFPLPRINQIVDPGCLLRIPSNPHVPIGCRENSFYHPIWTLLL